MAASDTVVVRPTIFPPLMLVDTIATPAVGTRQQFNEYRLKTPFRTGFWMREIRFVVKNLTAAMKTGPGDFWLKCQVGRNPLTSEFIPAWLIGKTLSNLQDIFWTPVQGGSNAIIPAFVWRFSKPMFVPAGESVTSYLWVRNDDVPAGGTCPDVSVVLAGRCAGEGEKPKTTSVPFISAFWGAKNVGGANYQDQSYERDLMNPFHVPLFIERFVGRVGVSTATSGNYDSNANAAAPVHDQAGATNTLVRGMSSIGGQLVKDQTPFDNLFYGPERSWPVHTWVDPKTFFKFYLTENYGALSASNFYRPQISLIGYREVALES